MPGSDGELTPPARTIRSADRRRRAGWAILAAVEVLLAGAVLRFVARVGEEIKDDFHGPFKVGPFIGSRSWHCRLFGVPFFITGPDRGAAQIPRTSSN
jgi:hypothetical protein